MQKTANKVVYNDGKRLPFDYPFLDVAAFDGSSIHLTRFNKIATQGAPQMAVDKEANSLSRVYSYYSKFNLRLFYL